MVNVRPPQLLEKFLHLFRVLSSVCLSSLAIPSTCGLGDRLPRLLGMS